jgi:hypothetical protein
MAQFSWQVYSCVFEVAVQERLLEILHFYFVLRENILGHCDNLTVSLFEFVGVWV